MELEPVSGQTQAAHSKRQHQTVLKPYINSTAVPLTVLASTNISQPHQLIHASAKIIYQQYTTVFIAQEHKNNHRNNLQLDKYPRKHVKQQGGAGHLEEGEKAISKRRSRLFARGVDPQEEGPEDQASLQQQVDF